MIEAGTIDRHEFETALSAAHDEGVVRDYKGLSAPLDGSLVGKVAEVWESVEQALRDAFVNGMEHARPALDKAVSSAKSLIHGAGARAKDVHQALLAKIQTYLARLVDAAISQVRRVIEVGNTQLELKGLEVSQRISLTGSLKASLTEGERLANVLQLAVKQHYGIRSEKLAEFGLQPFRGRIRKAKTPDPAPQTPTTPAAHAGTTP